MHCLMHHNCSMKQASSAGHFTEEGKALDSVSDLLSSQLGEQSCFLQLQYCRCLCLGTDTSHLRVQESKCKFLKGIRFPHFEFVLISDYKMDVKVSL